ncbi:hypothetical protein L6164_023063 [Bauhinia variegata]|uniref:Uncharacterized protein n=1 Tax=Bauhinia variegata TaxID=167791 RepID=A0ACB9MK68_BAUVA|nr:hypothetical protein L6164_023063 [Bauhinia variegata]
MVLLVQKFAKFYSKLESHHHQTRHESEEQELSSSLDAFRSETSKFIGQLGLDLKPGSELLSFSWIQKCFGLLPFIHKAFAKLVVDIDYPVSKWEADSIEGYLRYSLTLLDLINSISSSLSHLGQSRLSLSHGLSLLENSSSLAMKHLKAIEPGKFTVKFDKEAHPEADDGEARIFSGKEGIVHEAVEEMKRISFWVCEILLSGLCSDAKPYLEMRKIISGFDSSLIFKLDSKLSALLMEKKPVLKEVKELNDDIAHLLVASDTVKHEVVKELQRKLQVFEKLLDDLSKEVNDLFGKVMTQRTELVDCCRLSKQRQK